MANDVDFWNDIETLVKSGAGDPVHVSDLTNLYRLRYIEYDEELLDTAKEKFFTDYDYLPNIG